MTTPEAPTDFRYDAFLSYATEADYDLARELEDFLERFHELPTPLELELRPLSIWRDGSDVSIAEGSGRESINSILEGALAACRYLVLLWSDHSPGSPYMQLELEWFLRHRGPSSVRIGITEASDPTPTSTDLFLPSMIDAGITRQPWYDFRGFRKDRAPAARRLRDFDEARVQLAADLNGRSPAEIQPLWWRNKVREEQAHAEREARARRQVEIAECDARLEAANGWYERAFTAFAARDYGAVCARLLEALAVADPARVPDHYDRTPERPGWAEAAWSFLRYALALTPRVRAVPLSMPAQPEAQVELPLLEVSHPADLPPPRQLVWSDRGHLVIMLRRGVLEVYDLPHGALQATLRPAAGAFTAWAAAGSTDLVLAGTDSGRLTAWSRAYAVPLADHHGAAITAVDIALDGITAVTASADGEIRRWSDVTARSNIVRAAGGEGVTFVALVDEGDGVVYRSGSDLRLRNLASGEERLLHDGVASGPLAATDAGGAMIAYGDWDIVRRSDVHDPNNAILYVGEHQGFVHEIVFSAGGRHLFTRGTGGELCAWAGQERPLERGMSWLGARITQSFGSANRGSLLKRLDTYGEIDAIAPHPDDPDRFLVTRRGTVAEGNLGFAWRPAAGWRPAARGCRSAAWLPGGDIVCGGDDGVLALLPPDGDRAAVTLTRFDAAIGAVASSPDGALVAAVTEDGLVAVHVVEDGRQLAVAPLASVPFAVAFADSDTVAVGCADGVVRLWDWHGASAPRRLGACETPVLTLAVSGKARTLVAGADGGEVIAWDLAEEVQLWSTDDTPEGQGRLGGSVHDIAIAPDGGVVVAGMMFGAVRVVDMTTGRERAWIPVPPSVPGKPEQVTAVGMCDDGRTALVGLWDGTLSVIDVLAQRELLRFPAHTKVVTAAAQARGTGAVLTSSLDDDPENDTIRVWFLLDVETVPPPDPVRADWPTAVRTAVDRRNGAEPLAARPEAPRREPEAARIPALRAALAAEPRSPERNLELALALLETAHPAAAQDYVARTSRFGGDHLITHPQAQGLLAKSLLSAGELELALPWLRSASHARDPEALMQIGLLCLSGELRGGSEADGIAYLKKSAELGHAAAAYNLGVYYEHVAAGAVAHTDWRFLAFGESGGTSTHEADAIHWYTLAADQGYEPAEDALARLTGPPSILH
jgi:WD40 repeat protein